MHACRLQSIIPNSPCRTSLPKACPDPTWPAIRKKHLKSTLPRSPFTAPVLARPHALPLGYRTYPASYPALQLVGLWARDGTAMATG